MRIIIIEGTDKCGKDTLINELRNLSQHTLIIHCGKPVGDTEYERNINQDNLFTGYVDKLYMDEYSNVCNLIIFNRAWYGEYVYGSLYRNRTDDDLLNLINTIENNLVNFNSNDNDYCSTYIDDIYYIQLVNDSIELRGRLEDGESISQDKNMLMEETERFIDIYNKSIIPHKKLIYVNDGDMFRDKNDILNEVFDLLEQ